MFFEDLFTDELLEACDEAYEKYDDNQDDINLADEAQEKAVDNFDAPEQVFIDAQEAHDHAEDEPAENELADDDLADDELTDDDLADDEFADDELTDNELAEGEPAENELADDDLAEGDCVFNGNALQVNADGYFFYVLDGELVKVEGIANEWYALPENAIVPTEDDFADIAAKQRDECAFEYAKADADGTFYYTLNERVYKVNVEEEQAGIWFKLPENATPSDINAYAEFIETLEVAWNNQRVEFETARVQLNNLFNDGADPSSDEFYKAFETYRDFLHEFYPRDVKPLEDDFYAALDMWNAQAELRAAEAAFRDDSTAFQQYLDALEAFIGCEAFGRLTEDEQSGFSNLLETEAMRHEAAAVAHEARVAELKGLVDDVQSAIDALNPLLDKTEFTTESLLARLLDPNGDLHLSDVIALPEWDVVANLLADKTAAFEDYYAALGAYWAEYYRSRGDENYEALAGKKTTIARDEFDTAVEQFNEHIENMAEYLWFQAQLEALPPRGWQVVVHPLTGTERIIAKEGAYLTYMSTESKRFEERQFLGYLTICGEHTLTRDNFDFHLENGNVPVNSQGQPLWTKWQDVPPGAWFRAGMRYIETHSYNFEQSGIFTLPTNAANNNWKNGNNSIHERMLHRQKTSTGITDSSPSELAFGGVQDFPPPLYFDGTTISSDWEFTIEPKDPGDGTFSNKGNAGEVFEITITNAEGTVYTYEITGTLDAETLESLEQMDTFSFIETIQEMTQQASVAELQTVEAPELQENFSKPETITPVGDEAPEQSFVDVGDGGSETGMGIEPESGHEPKPPTPEPETEPIPKTDLKPPAPESEPETISPTPEPEAVPDPTTEPEPELPTLETEAVTDTIPKTESTTNPPEPYPTQPTPEPEHEIIPPTPKPETIPETEDKLIPTDATPTQLATFEGTEDFDKCFVIDNLGVSVPLGGVITENEQESFTVIETTSVPLGNMPQTGLADIGLIMASGLLATSIAAAAVIRWIVKLKKEN